MSLPLDDPLFPKRFWVDDQARALAEATPLGGSAARWKVRGSVAALEHWARGGSFHAYGCGAYDALVADGLSVEDAVERLRAHPGRLRCDGSLHASGRGMRWTVSYQRAGFPEERGFNSGQSTVEDCAYAALSRIEESERQVYEESIVVGTA